MKFLKIIAILFLGLIFNFSVSAQIYNTEVVAKIKVEKTSEYYQFTAISENLTAFDQSLRYEFMVFKTDENNNTVKSSQGDRFVLQSNFSVVLSSLTVSYSIEDKVILLLLIYDVDDKPVGKDRIVLEHGGRTKLDTNPKQLAQATGDQASPQDGVVVRGLIIENAITKAGRDFYRYFSQDYFNRGITTSKNILIEEVPGRTRSTLISVKVDGRLVWQFYSQPSKKFLQNMVQVSMQRTIAYLQQLQKQKNTITRY
jgi:hypothetical protein